MSPGITDAPSPGGWIQLHGVRIAKKLVLGAATLSAGAILAIFGPIDFNSVPGSSTGAVIKVDGVPRLQTFKVTCTASGGSTNYTACEAKSPLTSTGTITAFSIEAGNMQKHW